MNTFFREQGKGRKFSTFIFALLDSAPKPPVFHRLESSQHTSFSVNASRTFHRTENTEKTALHKHDSDIKQVSFPFRKTPSTLPPKAWREPRTPRHQVDRLTFTWLESPGLLPSGGFMDLLSTRGLTTCRKGLHSGKPLTLIPSKKSQI